MVKKGGCSNLLHPPRSTLSVRDQNHSCVSSKFTYSHDFKKAISQERIVLERRIFLQTGFFTLFYPHARFGEDSRTWVDSLSNKAWIDSLSNKKKK